MVSVFPKFSVLVLSLALLPGVSAWAETPKAKASVAKKHSKASDRAIKNAKRPAKAKPTLADKKAAKKAFLAARKLYRAEEYKLALPLFQKAYELSQHRPTTILALAQCERQLKLYDSAIAHFEAFLATKPKRGQIKRANETLVILRQQSTQAKREKAEADKRAKADQEKRRQEAEALARLVAPPTGPMAAKVKAKPKPFWKNRWLWAGVIGAAVVSGATAGYFRFIAEPDYYGGSAGVVVE